MSQTTFTVEPGTQEVVMSRLFQAPVEKLWEATTSQAGVAQWWGGRTFTTEIQAFDFREGGSWRFVQRQGDQEYPFHGYYVLIEPHQRVVDTFEFDGLPERHVLMESAVYTPEAGGTRLTVTSVYPTVEERDGMVASGMERGATEAWETLAKLVEG